ncbi:hypothetical protein EG240_15675 [Paenimyroides tangerinum]|uniref:Uncharacterized protein n=1 Tax=Paenimyroides tangerinum TaxID=2488728 RepID=A0A3P3W276_9FLAO|nr:hypothetical protein [Paenimyroides tangerinum]RRJ86923.1 hypothetical protein EG240_15675 [Paenimyroides tangerinum]
MSTSSEEEVALRFYFDNLKKTGQGAMIKVISKNGKSIDRYSDATEFEILHKSNLKFRINDIIPDYFQNPAEVALDGESPIKFTLFIIEEL